MDGLLPLTYTTIADWAKLEDVHVKPHEVRALIELDKALLYPTEEEEA